MEDEQAKRVALNLSITPDRVQRLKDLALVANMSASRMVENWIDQAIPEESDDDR